MCPDILRNTSHKCRHLDEVQYLSVGLQGHSTSRLRGCWRWTFEVSRALREVQVHNSVHLIQVNVTGHLLQWPLLLHALTLHWLSSIQLQKTVMGSLTFSKNLQEQCALFVAERGLDVDALFTDEFRLDEAERAYELFDQRKIGKGVFVFD